MSAVLLRATPAAIQHTGTAYYVAKVRASALAAWSRTADIPAWTREAWMQALSLSVLPIATVRSLLILLDVADNSGNVRLTREAVAEALGLSRVASVSAHWKQGRAASLMVSTSQFNRPMLHRLTIPGGDMTPPLPRVRPLHTLTWAEASGAEHVSTDVLASAALGRGGDDPRLPGKTP
ncbi:hypothetical protein AAGW05_16730 [Arthrobacter sp. LAPM80]|uniref:hypothetical protein n=1 Tax=Arthrobacter sp. LAPM80 TaxID=3141788 RepID=UPI00398A8E5C